MGRFDRGNRIADFMAEWCCAHHRDCTTPSLTRWHSQSGRRMAALLIKRFKEQLENDFQSIAVQRGLKKRGGR